MRYRIYPSKLDGVVHIPSSKNYCHRALICASLCSGRSVIHNFLSCEDTEATISCLRSLGVTINVKDEDVEVISNGKLHIKGKLDAHDSASTLRFLLPVICTFEERFSFYGSKALMQRINTKDLIDLNIDIDCFDDHIEVRNGLNNLAYNLDISMTSQWATGLIFTLPFEGAKVYCERNSFLDITVDTLAKFGVIISNIDGKYEFISGDYKPCEFTPEGSFSLAANFLTMPNVKVEGLNPQSLQANKKISNYVELLESSDKEITIDMKKNADIIPAIMARAAVSLKKTTILGIHSYEKKELARTIKMCECLNLLGANAIYEDGKVIIEGKEKIKGDYNLDCPFDHRIVMALISLADKIEKPFTISPVEAVKKSCNQFCSIFSAAGGKYDPNVLID